jgi:hypothetical protein
MLMARLRFPAWLGVMVAASVFSPGCSCGEPGSSRGFVSSGTSTGGGISQTSGTGGDGGGGPDAGPPASAAGRATDTVSAGNTARSPSYRMVFTLGQPTQNQGKTTSPRYRMQGGLVGANGSLP